MEIVGYRWADYDTPLWSNPNRSAGRWHVLGDDPTQYFALHPLGPWAEYVRGQDINDPTDLVEIQSRIWAVRLEFEPGSLCEIDFESAPRWGIEAHQLVGDNYGPCQDLASTLRADFRGIVVPSAALPGTSNLVLFGAYAMSPYNLPPPDVDFDVPAALLSEHGGPAASIVGMVCLRGASHSGLRAWIAGETPPVVNPTYGWP